MTKTLTEQLWREELPSGYYYIKNKEETYIHEIFMTQSYKVPDGLEVLAPVPSYKEYKRLQEQLNEANEIIKKYATGTFKMRCRKYEGKAVGTDIITGEPVSEDLYGEYYYSDIPMSNKTDVAKKYLKKWGVK